MPDLAPFINQKHNLQDLKRSATLTPTGHLLLSLLPTFLQPLWLSYCSSDMEDARSLSGLFRLPCVSLCYLCGSPSSSLSEVLPFLYLKSKNVLTSSSSNCTGDAEAMVGRTVSISTPNKAVMCYSCHYILQHYTHNNNKKYISLKNFLMKY